MKLVIDVDGDVHGVYSDSLSKLNLGTLHVDRASHVEFCYSSQEWLAYTDYNKIIASGKNRDDVIKEEIRIIEYDLVKKLCKNE
jgi:hypothetical protein